MTLGRKKCVVEIWRRANTRKNHFRGYCDDVTLLSVFSASGKILTPLVVLSRNQAKYRKRGNRKFETPLDCILKQNDLYMCPIAGVYTSIFSDWATNLVSETLFL